MNLAIVFKKIAQHKKFVQGLEFTRHENLQVAHTTVQRHVKFTGVRLFVLNSTACPRYSLEILSMFGANNDFRRIQV
jgi:hypothetical protein